MRLQEWYILLSFFFFINLDKKKKPKKFTELQGLAHCCPWRSPLHIYSLLFATEGGGGGGGGGAGGGGGGGNGGGGGGERQGSVVRWDLSLRCMREY
jgi:hypothetical protein